MYCKYCGEWIDDGSRVCRHCGKSQEQKTGSSIHIDMRGIAAGVGAKNSVVGGAGGIVKDIDIRKSTTRKNISTTVDNRGGLIQRSTIGDTEGRIGICPYCGKELNFPKPPRFCPYCKEQIRE